MGDFVQGGAAAPAGEPEPVASVAVGIVRPAVIDAANGGDSGDVAPAGAVELLGSVFRDPLGEIADASCDVDGAIAGGRRESVSLLLQGDTLRPDPGEGIEDPDLVGGGGSVTHPEAAQDVEIGADGDRFIEAPAAIAVVGGQRGPAVVGDVVDKGRGSQGVSGDKDSVVDEDSVAAAQGIGDRRQALPSIGLGIIAVERGGGPAFRRIILTPDNVDVAMVVGYHGAVAAGRGQRRHGLPGGAVRKFRGRTGGEELEVEVLGAEVAEVERGGVRGSLQEGEGDVAGGHVDAGVIPT